MDRESELIASTSYFRELVDHSHRRFFFREVPAVKLAVRMSEAKAKVKVGVGVEVRAVAAVEVWVAEDTGRERQRTFESLGAGTASGGRDARRRPEETVAVADTCE